MKSPSTKIRFSEAQKLLDYGFNQYKIDIIRKEIELGNGRGKK